MVQSKAVKRQGSAAARRKLTKAAPVRSATLALSARVVMVQHKIAKGCNTGMSLLQIRVMLMLNTRLLGASTRAGAEQRKAASRLGAGASLPQIREALMCNACLGISMMMGVVSTKVAQRQSGAAS